VGRVSPDIDDFEAKRDAYACDITYGTNTEFGFDYLRDNMAGRADPWSSAATPSPSSTRSTRSSSTRPGRRSSSRGRQTSRPSSTTSSPDLARTLIADDDYEVDEEKRIVVPTEEGIAKVERQLGVDNMYDAVSVNYVHQLTQALRAKELYRRDKDYLVADGEVKIVDEFTGGPSRAAVVRRAPPGGRGQGARPDRRGEPHLGHGHPPELLPPLREARPG
jgi:preprotein translocase subunit SecA